MKNYTKDQGRVLVQIDIHDLIIKISSQLQSYSFYFLLLLYNVLFLTKTHIEYKEQLIIELKIQILLYKYICIFIKLKFFYKQNFV